MTILMKLEADSKAAPGMTPGLTRSALHFRELLIEGTQGMLTAPDWFGALRVSLLLRAVFDGR